MTYSFQSAAFEPIAASPRSRYFKNSVKTYQCEIYGFDNELEVLHIEARNAEQAAEEAQSYVDFDIYNVNVYLAA